MKVSIIEELIIALNKSNISYFFFREFDGFSGNDIDIFVSFENKDEFLWHLIKLGWYERKEAANSINHSFYIHPCDGQFITLDVNYHLIFGNENNLIQWNKLDKVKIIEGYDSKPCRPRGDYLLSFLLLHILLEKRNINLKELNRWNDFYDLYYIGDMNSNDYINIGRDIIELGNKCKETDISLLSEYIDVLDNVQYKKDKIKDSFNILFLGADGTGKSTLIRKVSDSGAFKTQNYYFGQKNWKIKFLSKLSISSNKLIKIIYKYLLYPLDIFLRRLIIRRESIHISLIDRFPGTSFINNRLLKSIYFLVLPKVDLIVLLVGDPTEISLRKDEITAEQYVKEERKWRRLTSIIGSNIIEINTTQLDTDKSLATVMSCLAMDKKFLKFYLKDIDAKRT